MDDNTAVKHKKVKSKSFIQEQTRTEKSKSNKSFDFASLHNKVGLKENEKNGTPKRAYMIHKQEKLDDSKVTSTPISNADKHKSLKSIMKGTPVAGAEPSDLYTPDYYANKRKKRNKSVSFVLEDETASKKQKPDDESGKTPKKSPKKYAVSPIQEKIRKKEKKNKNIETGDIEHAEKENINESNQSNLSKVNKETEKSNEVSNPEAASVVDDARVKLKKKKNKKNKRVQQISTDNNEDTKNTQIENKTTETSETKSKEKKKKRKSKQTSNDTDEPITKTRKQETEVTIAEDLENLNIGDNPHSLTNLLDEMTVVDKNKNKRNKTGKEKKGKGSKASKSNTETLGQESNEEIKEKVKWKKRKWNKDKKEHDDFLLTSVIVENLPLKIMLNYKKVLSEHFSSCGVIKGIGIAEVYPTEEPKPVFTTTVNFSTESDATKALEEDNTSFAGSRIRVKRPLPPTDTTLVVRSYGELTDQAVSSVFIGAGRIRNIRHSLKGRHTIGTAFVEFDGPQSVERALKMAQDAKIGGKKIYLSRFEDRSSKKPKENKKNEKQESNSSDDD